MKKCLLTLSLLISSLAYAQDDGVAFGKSQETCLKVYENSMQHYRALAKFLPAGFQLRDQLPTHQLLKLKGDGCGNSSTIELFQKVASLHSQKIALLLPFSRWSQSTQKSVMEQIKSYFAGQGFDQKQLIILDTAGNVQIMQQQLAQLVFTQHVSTIVGGLTAAEAPALTGWAIKLRIPTIILNKKFEPPRNRFVFRVGPDQRDLATSLLAHAESKGYKKLAVMMPQTSRDGTFADALKANGKIEIVGPIVYNPGDFSSIDFSFKGLFHLNDELRKPELLDLITEQKERAKAEGVAFDPKGIMLPPQIDVDAIVIIDHFKNVRHLAKSLHFYGVKGLPLLGIPKWRAPEILDREEENLRGAVFVDYVGSYRALPYGITANTVVDENFVEGSAASRVDLELVITHALASATAAIKGPRIARLALYKRIEAAAPEDKNFFGMGGFFRSDHEGNWPTFLFSVQNGKLNPIGKNIGRRRAPKKLKSF